MGMQRWDPFADMAQLREQVNRLFEQSISHSGEELAPARTWSPAVDIYETPDAIGVRMDIAGVKPDEIDIQISGDTLTIRGERTLKTEESGKQFIRLERSHGPFQRSFTLGVPVDQQAVRAAYHDGMLEVTLPKREEVKPKQVKITVQASPNEEIIEAE